MGNTVIVQKIVRPTTDAAQLVAMLQKSEEPMWDIAHRAIKLGAKELREQEPTLSEGEALMKFLGTDSGRQLRALYYGADADLPAREWVQKKAAQPAKLTKARSFLEKFQADAEERARNAGESIQAARVQLRRDRGADFMQQERDACAVLRKAEAE